MSLAWTTKQLLVVIEMAVTRRRLLTKLASAPHEAPRG